MKKAPTKSCRNFASINLSNRLMSVVPTNCYARGRIYEVFCRLYGAKLQTFIAILRKIQRKTTILFGKVGKKKAMFTLS